MAVGVLAVSLSGPLMALMVVPPVAIAFWRNGLAPVALAPAATLRRRDEADRATRPHACVGACLEGGARVVVSVDSNAFRPRIWL